LVALQRTSQRNVLKLPTQEIVPGERVQVACEAKDAEHADQQRQADGEITSLKTGQGGAIYICPGSDFGLRHVTAKAGEAQALSERRSTTP
jgi:hypothetical protein